MLFRAAKALAALDGRDHALPDDVQAAGRRGAHPPPAAVARDRLATSAPRSCATRWSGSRRSDGLMAPRGPHGAVRAGAVPGRRDRSTRRRCTCPAWRSSLLAVGAVVWVRARRAAAPRSARMPGPPTVVEDEPYPLRVEVRSGVLPPPGGELIEPLLGWPVPVAGRWSRRLRINVRFSRRGRRVLEPERARDPRPAAAVLARGVRVRAGRGAGAAARRAGDRAGQRRRREGRRRRARRGAEPVGRAGSTPRPPSSRSTACAPYREGAPASRIHWPSVAGTARCWSGGSSRSSTPRRWSCWTRRIPPARRSSTWPCAPRRRCACGWRARTAARCCCPATAARSRSGTTWAPGPRVHARLALVEEGQAPAPGVLGPRGGAVIWVTGADLRATPRALERMPAGVALRGRARARSRASAPPSRWPAAPAAWWSACGEEWRHERARCARPRRPPQPAPRRRSRVGRAAAAVASDSLVLRLVAFSALGGFAAAHWGGLVDGPARRAHAARAASSPPAAPPRSGCSAARRSRARRVARASPR